MLAFRDIMAGLALSTALAGGAVGLGALMGTTAASAAVVQEGYGSAWPHDCCRCDDCRCDRCCRYDDCRRHDCCHCDGCCQCGHSGCDGGYPR
ncbi:hypothetical protein [Sphaerimonospora thailandensis]|nr:hypothetical protein [Sphaerimonospora thailandensis]